MSRYCDWQVHQVRGRPCCLQALNRGRPVVGRVPSTNPRTPAGPRTLSRSWHDDPAFEQIEPTQPVLAGQSTPQARPRSGPGSEPTDAPVNRFRAFVGRHALAIFFALSYLIAWSTLPFGTFLPFGPLVSALVVVLIAEGLPGLARLGQRVIRWRVNWIWYAAAIGLPLLVHLVAICLNMAAGAPAPSLTQVPAVVRSAVAIRPPDGESPGRSAWGGTRVARLRSAAAPVEVVTLGVDHPARGVDYRLASATGLDAAVRPRPARPRVDGGGHLLVCLVVQPDWRQRAADAHRSRYRGLHQHPGLLVGRRGCRPRGLDVFGGLDTARRSPVDLRSEVLAYGTDVGNRPLDQLTTIPPSYNCLAEHWIHCASPRARAQGGEWRSSQSTNKPAVLANTHENHTGGTTFVDRSDGRGSLFHRKLRTDDGIQDP